MRRHRRRALAAGGVVGPVAFVAAWAELGTRLPGYSPTGDAISRLAATDAPTRWAMTAGLVVLGTGVGAYGLALRDTDRGPAWTAAFVCGLAGLAVAALPLSPDRGDGSHTVAAAVSYAALAATPLLAARAEGRAGHRRRAAVSVLAGAVCGACLAATSVAPLSGLFQRIGLTVGHGWIATSALRLLRRPPSC
ncbi:MAG: DUF998 domain-containing protein [Acidimicrobiales bacterium]